MRTCPFCQTTLVGENPAGEPLLCSFCGARLPGQNGTAPWPAPEDGSYDLFIEDGDGTSPALPPLPPAPGPVATAPAPAIPQALKPTVLEVNQPVPFPVPAPPTPPRRALWPWLLGVVLLLGAGVGVGFAIKQFLVKPKPEPVVTDPEPAPRPDPDAGPAPSPKKELPPKPDPSPTPAPMPRTERPEVGQLTVAQKGGGDHVRIADALKAARSGMVIKIKPGTYDESLTLDADVTLEGDGDRDQITIRGTNAPAVTLRHPGATIRNLGLRSARKEQNAPAVRLLKGGVLERCDIRSEAVAGVEVQAGSRGGQTMADCVFREGPVGLLVRDGGVPNLTDCRFLQQETVGVQVEKGGRLHARRCRISGRQQGGVLIDGGNADLIENCVIEANGDTGVWVDKGGSVRLLDSVVRRNKGWGLRAVNGGRFDVGKCEFKDNTRGNGMRDPDCKSCQVDGKPAPLKWE
jgi:hypothetical protein